MLNKVKSNITCPIEENMHAFRMKLIDYLRKAFFPVPPLICIQIILILVFKRMCVWGTCGIECVYGQGDWFFRFCSRTIIRWSFQERIRRPANLYWLENEASVPAPLKTDMPNKNTDIELPPHRIWLPRESLDRTSNAIKWRGRFPHCLSGLLAGGMKKWLGEVYFATSQLQLRNWTSKLRKLASSKEKQADDTPEEEVFIGTSTYLFSLRCFLGWCFRSGWLIYWIELLSLHFYWSREYQTKGVGKIMERWSRYQFGFERKDRRTASLEIKLWCHPFSSIKKYLKDRIIWVES